MGFPSNVEQVSCAAAGGKHKHEIRQKTLQPFIRVPKITFNSPPDMETDSALGITALKPELGFALAVLVHFSVLLKQTLFWQLLSFISSRSSCSDSTGGGGVLEINSVTSQ